MDDSTPPMLTSIAVPGKSVPGLEEPIVAAAEPNTIAIKIRDAILREPKLGGAELEIRASDDHATVSGEVKDDGQRVIALNIAGRYVGRDRVIDEITLPGQSGYFCES
ncbi:MAG: BON domain-containing protein [Armatimonadota bacterium]